MLSSTAALAQPKDPVTAEALFKAGRSAADLGEHAEACEKFQESHRLDPALGTLLNIGICEEGLGNLAGAWQHYQEVIHGLDARDGRLPVAQARAAALDPRLPRLVIRRAPNAPEAMRVRREGIELTEASFDVALPINPGRHSLVVTATGYDEQRFWVQLDEGQTRELVVHTGPKTAPPRSPPPATKEQRAALVPRARPVMRPPMPPDESSVARPTGFAILGVGAASLGVGAVAGALVLDRKNTVDAECEVELCTSRGLRAADDGRRFTRLSTATFAIGIAGVGAGLYLVLKRPRRTAITATVSPERSSIWLVQPF